jgi:hypothetical protein
MDTAVDVDAMARALVDEISSSSRPPSTPMGRHTDRLKIPRQIRPMTTSLDHMQ